MKSNCIKIKAITLLNIIDEIRIDRKLSLEKQYNSIDIMKHTQSYKSWKTKSEKLLWDKYSALKAEN